MLLSFLLFACLDTSVSRYFIQLTPEHAEATYEIKDLASDFDLEILHEFDSFEKGFSSDIPKYLVGQIEGLNSVEQVYLDEEKPYIPLPVESFSTYGEDEIQPNLRSIRIPNTVSSSLSNIHVAVLDTGIDSQHHDLRVFAEMDVVGLSTGVFAGGTDPGGHGTHVAGIIGARVNDVDIAGVAPGVALHSVRVLNAAGKGYFSDIMAGLNYVYKNPNIRIVNLSLNTTLVDNLRPLQNALRALEEAGVVVVMSAGNNNDDTKNYAPSAYDHGIIVSAYDITEQNGELQFNGFYSQSNFGPEVDIAAPGVAITSTIPYDRSIEDAETTDTETGTSQAAPHVTGAVALLLNEHPDLSAYQVRDYIIATGTIGYEGWSETGRHSEPFLNIERLLDTVQ